MIVRAMTLFLAMWLASSLSACTPKVQIAVPSEPITINLNITVKIEVDEDLEALFEDDDELF